MKIILKTFLLVLLMSQQAFSIVASVRSGKWGSISTWENGVLPSENDTVLIQNSHLISISENSAVCKNLMVKGEITFLSSGKKLRAIELNLLDSGKINASVLGSIESQTINVLGVNEISGVNLNCLDSFIVKGHVFLKRKSGIKNFHHVQILHDGIWQVTDDASFTINGNFFNSGKLIAGNGTYIFNNENTIQGNSSTIFNKLQFSGNLFNADSLTIVTSIESLNLIALVNLSGATLVSLTSPANFKTPLNLTSKNNTFVLSRNQNQTLPSTFLNQYYHLHVQNDGVCSLNSDFIINGDLVLKNKSILNLNDFKISGNGLGVLSMKDSSNLQFYNYKPNEFNLFINGFLNHSLEASSKLSVYTNSNLTLPSHFLYPNLELYGLNELRIVRFSGFKGRVFGGLYSNPLIHLDLDSSFFELKGMWTGSGVFSAENSKVLYSGNALQKVFACNYDTLQFDNSSLDTTNAFGLFTIKTLLVSKGILKLGSVLVIQSKVDKEGQIIIGGSSPIFQDSLIIKGKFLIQSDFASCRFGHLKVFDTGQFLNNGASDISINGSIYNDGVFKGCLGTGCTWEIRDNLNFVITGKSEIYLPRLSLTAETNIHNKGNLLISNRIFGYGSIINYSFGILNLGMNPELMEAKINSEDHQGNTVIFSNNGDQDIAQHGLTYFHNLQIKGLGVKKLQNSVFIQGNLSIDTLATLHSAYNTIQCTEKANFTMFPFSNLILGDYLNEFPTPFPLNVKGINCFLDSTSTVTYSSWKNQEISASPQYGNLVLQDGVGDSNKKTLVGGDLLVIKGKLDIQESSVLFWIEDKNIELSGDWNGVGKVNMSNGIFSISGNGNHTGEFIPGMSTVIYQGSSGQKIKVGSYYNLTIDKNFGNASVVAENDYLKIQNKLWVKNGTMEIKGEKIHVMDSAIIEGKIIFTSRVQEKRLTNVLITKKGSFDNSYGVDIFIDGNVLNHGSFTNSSRYIYFNNQLNEQSLINKGTLLISGLEINKGTESLSIEGAIVIKDSLLFKSGEIQLRNCELTLNKQAYIKGESEKNKLSGETSKIITQHQIISGENKNIKGLGLSIKSDIDLGLVSIERHFSPYDIYYDFPGIKKSFLIKPVVDSGFVVEMKIKYYPHELNGIIEKDLVMYKSQNLGESFIKQASFLDLNHQELSLSNVTSFSLWTAGDNNINPLPLNLLSFKGERINDKVSLSWETLAEWNVKLYQIWHSKDGVNYDLLQEIKPLGGFNTPNWYAISEHNLNETWTYYRLIEIDADGNSNYLNQISIEPYQALITKVQVVGSTVFFQNITKSAKICIYNLDGKQIASYHNLDKDFSIFMGQTGVYLIQITGDNFLLSEKIYIR